MKVIFLDFDGVINSSASFIYEVRIRKNLSEKERDLLPPVNETLCNICISNLKVLLGHAPDAKIVISSSWRNLYDFSWLKAKLGFYGISNSLIIDKTPDLMFKGRGAEISYWLEDHPEVIDYVILDDNTMNGHGSKFVKTTWRVGLTLDHVIKAAIILGSETILNDFPDA